MKVKLMGKRQSHIITFMVVVVVAGMAQAVVLQEDFESQIIPSTDTPPAGWTFVNVEDQLGTFYEAVMDGNDTVGRVKADVVVNTFFAAGYMVNTTGVVSSQGFSGSFELLVEDEGGWSDGLFMFGDIADGHTSEYYKLKYVGGGNKTAIFDSNYPGTQQTNVLSMETSVSFNTWYRTDFTWEPTQDILDPNEAELDPNEAVLDPNAPRSVVGIMTFEISDQDGVFLESASVELALPELVYFGFGSSNDAIRVDNVVIETAEHPVEDFESQTPPSTDAPPVGWAFMDVENQDGTYYEAAVDSNNLAGRVKADVVVNTFFAAGYIVNKAGVNANLGFVSGFDILVEDEGGWSDGLFMIGDIIDGHTADYYKLKYVGAGNSIAVFDSNYPGTQQINVMSMETSVNFNTWYHTDCSWEPSQETLDPNDLAIDPNETEIEVQPGVAGTMTFDIWDMEGVLLESASVELTLPEVVYLGFGSSNDAIRVDNVAIQAYILSDEE